MGKESRRKKQPVVETVVEAPAPSLLERSVGRWAWPLAAVLVLACAFLLAAFKTCSDDLFMHLAVGRRFFETGHFPDPDPWLFSLTDYHRGWIDLAYWGAHLGATKLYELGGFTLISFLKAVLVVLGAAAPLWLALRLGYRSFLAPALLLLGLWAASDRFIERGSLISDCLGPWVIALLMAEIARPSRLRWALPVIIAVWTNLHPGVLTGLVLILCAAVARWREWRRWWPLVAACLVASVVHPDGARHLVWAMQSAGGGTGAFRKHNIEQMPTLAAEHFDSREVWLFFALAAFTWLALGAAFLRGRRPWFALLALAALTYLGLSTIRFVTTASMALPALAVGILAGARREPARRFSLAATALTALCAGGLDVKLATSGYTASSGSRQLGFGLDRSVYPFAPADFLTSIPLHGRIFNEHSFGAFLAWYWDGKPPIFFHGYLLDEHFYEQDYLGVNKSEAEFDRIVKQYDIGAFFMFRMPVGGGMPLIYRMLLTKPEWRLVYVDGRSMVFLQDRPEHQAILATSELRYLDPFRPERLERGMKEDPPRVLEEAVRQLHFAPDDRRARAVIEQLFHKDADVLVRERYGG